MVHEELDILGCNFFAIVINESERNVVGMYVQDKSLWDRWVGLAILQAWAHVSGQPASDSVSNLLILVSSGWNQVGICTSDYKSSLVRFYCLIWKDQNQNQNQNQSGNFQIRKDQTDARKDRSFLAITSWIT